MQFSDLFNPEFLLHEGGPWLLFLIVFAETGIMAGFFLPGDSLLFTAGLLTATGVFDWHISAILAMTCLAAIAGDQSSYWFGRKVGGSLFNREDSLIFKKRYLEMARDFYQRNGVYALIMAKFIPIFRTFVPIFAGVVKYNYARFIFVDISGVLLWVNAMMLAGFFLGEIPWVQHNLEKIIIGLIIVTTIPVIRTFLNERRRAKDQTPPSAN